MRTIGLFKLPGSTPDHEPSRGRDWRLIALPAKGARRGPSERAIADSRLDAIAILGLGLRKTLYAEKALLSGKHVLVDFPLGHDFGEISRLEKIAEDRELCIYSPNLLRTESGIQELKRMASGSSGKILSLTITCGLNTRFESSEWSMKLIQFLDLSEWIVGSKCVEAYGRKSTNHPSSVALVVTLSFDSGVKTLLNLYSAPKNPMRLWIDGIFEHSVAHVDPYAQTVRLSRFSDNTGETVNWAPSPLSIAIEDFVAHIRSEKRISLSDDLERIFTLACNVLTN